MLRWKMNMSEVENTNYGRKSEKDMDVWVEGGDTRLMSAAAAQWRPVPDYFWPAPDRFALPPAVKAGRMATLPTWRPIARCSTSVPRCFRLMAFSRCWNTGEVTEVLGGGGEAVEHVWY